MRFLNYLNNVYLGNSIQDYLCFILALLLGFIAGKIIHQRIITKLQSIFSEKTNNFFKIIISFLEKTVVFLTFWLVIYFSKNLILDIPRQIDSYFNIFINIVIIIKIIPVLSKLIDDVINIFYKKYQDNEEVKLDKQLINIISIFSKLTLWIAALIFIISQLGYDITSLIAGLGI